MTHRFYVYQYLRIDGTPYYIGKGSGRRFKSKGKNEFRPPSHDRIEIIVENLCEEDAFRLEQYLISWWGRKDIGTGILRNRTDGGEGSSNFSSETREKLREAGYRHIISEKGRKKISDANKGNKYSLGRPVTEANRIRFIESRLGNTYRLGKTHTEEAKEKIRAARKLQVSPSLGKTRSEEQKQRISLGISNQQRFTCVHCGIVAIIANINRWHNDKCKQRIIVEDLIQA